MGKITFLCNFELHRGNTKQSMPVRPKAPLISLINNRLPSNNASTDVDWHLKSHANFASASLDGQLQNKKTFYRPSVCFDVNTGLSNRPRCHSLTRRQRDATTLTQRLRLIECKLYTASFAGRRYTFGRFVAFPCLFISGGHVGIVVMFDARSPVYESVSLRTSTDCFYTSASVGRCGIENNIKKENASRHTESSRTIDTPSPSAADGLCILLRCIHCRGWRTARVMTTPRFGAGFINNSPFNTNSKSRLLLHSWHTVSRGVMRSERWEAVSGRSREVMHWAPNRQR